MNLHIENIFESLPWIVGWLWNKFNMMMFLLEAACSSRRHVASAEIDLSSTLNSATHLQVCKLLDLHMTSFLHLHS